MAIDYSVLTLKKSTPARVERDRKARHEQSVQRRVRADVEHRDGFCRLNQADADLTRVVGDCQGVSEWAHFADHRRFKTRGQDAEQRHTREGSFMACTRHHRDYDHHRIQIEALTTRGAEGPLEVTKRPRTYRESRSRS